MSSAGVTQTILKRLFAMRARASSMANKSEVATWSCLPVNGHAKNVARIKLLEKEFCE